jgi:undecaprenyl-diphosphatase
MGKIYRIANPHSFPSGHAARCAMLTVVGLALGPFWVGILLLVYAIMVSFSRVMMGVHYFSDVFVGAVIGVAIGELTLFIPFHWWTVYFFK